MTDTSSYANNRRSDWGYDADGRNTSIDTRSYAFDAAGQMADMTGQQWLINHYTTVSQTSGYDGDGMKAQEVDNGVTTYYLTSSVLGGAIIEEMSNTGQKNVGYVYAGGQLLAKQSANQVTWKHPTPAGTSEYLTFNDNSPSGRNEFDPLGADLALQYTPPPENPENEGDIGAGHFGGIMDARWSNFFNLSSGCTINGSSAATCSEAIAWVNSGAGQQCTNNECARYTVVKGALTPQVFHHEADGYSGYETVGAKYGGNGYVSDPTDVDREIRLDEDSRTAPQKPVESTPDMRAIEGALSHCLATKFQDLNGHPAVKLVAFDPSYKGHSGTTNVDYLDKSAPGRTGEYSVKNDVTTYKYATLPTYARGDQGFTDPKSPYVNFTISDVDKHQSFDPRLDSIVGGYIGTQIHELGNSIDRISGNYIGKSSAQHNGIRDPDSGYQLELCVLDELQKRGFNGQ